MVTQDTANELWFHWMFIFGGSTMAYTIIYRFAFEKQLSHSNVVTTIDNNSNNMYNPSNCLKYASCIASFINCIICSLASLSLFYHKYWEDPIYGTPGIPFYVTATIQAYFIVDLGGDIIIYFWYNLPSFRYDILIHHLFGLSIIPWITMPIPQYAWMMITIGFAFEVSTIFLNAIFFAKWYDKSESLIFKYKLAFLFSWFLIRVPGSLGIVYWIIIYLNRLFNEYPFNKFIAVIVIATANLIIQSLWSVLIIRKIYRTLTASDAYQDAVDGFDLKRRSSVEVTNVTSEP